MEGVSIIVPALNEEESIGAVLDDIKEVMENNKVNYEVIVVNDGSKDKTGDIARDKGATVIRHPYSAGYGASIQEGMNLSTFGIIVIIDADGTYPVKKIPELVEYLSEFDMVVGARTGKNYRGSLLKHPLRKFFQLLCEFVTGVRIPDANSGLRAFKKNIVTKFRDNFCPGFSFTTTITLALHINGYFVKYVPIEYYKRSRKSNIRWIRDTLRATQIITQAILYYNPIKLFLLLSIIIFFGFALSLVLYFITKTLFSLLFSISFFVISFLFFGMGFLADAIIHTKNINIKNDRLSKE